VNRSQGKFLQTMPCQHTQQFIKYSKKALKLNTTTTKKHLRHDIYVNTLQKCGFLNFGVGPQFYYFRAI
jgi:hypothetical protein